MNRVYIVEDDRIIAREVATHLAKWQYECMCTKDFQKISEEVSEYKPDIILMNIKLPYFCQSYLIILFFAVKQT